MRRGLNVDCSFDSIMLLFYTAHGEIGKRGLLIVIKSRLLYLSSESCIISTEFTNDGPPTEGVAQVRIIDIFVG